MAATITRTLRTASVTRSSRHLSQRLPAHVYRRRRVTVGSLVVGVVAAVSMVATGTLAGPGGVPASASGAAPAVERATVVARPGDTLWSIAREHRGAVAHAAYVDLLVRVNGGASIVAGQVVQLP